MAKLVFHVDVNSAYLSWEAARRVANGEPDIRLIPAVIGGDREKRTGVVLAKSIPAKKFGIKTGEPIGMALRKCPDLFMAKPDFRLYEENSKKFMDICREYAPIVEKASVDGLLRCHIRGPSRGCRWPSGRRVRWGMGPRPPLCNMPLQHPARCQSTWATRLHPQAHLPTRE